MGRETGQPEITPHIKSVTKLLLLTNAGMLVFAKPIRDNSQRIDYFQVVHRTRDDGFSLVCEDATKKGIEILSSGVFLGSSQDLAYSSPADFVDTQTAYYGMRGRLTAQHILQFQHTNEGRGAVIPLELLKGIPQDEFVDSYAFRMLRQFMFRLQVGREIIPLDLRSYNAPLGKTDPVFCSYLTTNRWNGRSAA